MVDDVTDLSLPVLHHIMATEQATQKSVDQCLQEMMEKRDKGVEISTGIGFAAVADDCKGNIPTAYGGKVWATAEARKCQVKIEREKAVRGAAGTHFHHKESCQGLLIADNEPAAKPALQLAPKQQEKESVAPRLQLHMKNTGAIPVCTLSHMETLMKAINDLIVTTSPLDRFSTDHFEMDGISALPLAQQRFIESAVASMETLIQS